MLGGLPAFAQEQVSTSAPTQASSQIYEPAYFTRFAPKTAADMVNNIAGFEISGSDDERGFGQAKQNVLINGRRVSGKSNDAATALSRIAADTVLRIEIIDGATLNIPGLSGQVANVVAKVDALSGNWYIQPEFRENLQPSWYNGSVSANGKSGGWSWSAALTGREFHNGHDGPGVIINGAGVVTDVRREGFNGAGEEPELNATVTYETTAGSIVNVNLALTTFNFVGREDSFRDDIALPPRNRFVSIGEDETGGEVGADWEFDLGPGRLKVIGLHRQEEGDELVTVETYDDATGFILGGDRVLAHSEEGESIARGEYNFGAFGGDMQWAAEGAFNFGDLHTQLAQRQANGGYPLATLDEGTARVEERRGETNLSYSRKLSDAWSLQSSLGVEYSELSVNFPVLPPGVTQQQAPREFVRQKGFLALVWKIDDKLDISFKGERRVGQLDFGDFLSAVDLQQGASQSGNVELVPEQSWIASAEINKKLGAWGALKLILDSRLIEDVVDQIPIGVSGTGVGNLEEATAWSVTGSGTINFDPIGLKGLQFAFNWRYGDSEVDDPLTGIPREISGSTKLNGNMSLRWDVPETPWTLVAGIEEYQSYARYRLDQIARDWTAPSTNFFSIENKDVYGMKVRLQVVNLNDTSENFKREVYFNGRRTNPLNFTEERHRTFGPIVRLNVSGTF